MAHVLWLLARGVLLSMVIAPGGRLRQRRSCSLYVFCLQHTACFKSKNDPNTFTDFLIFAQRSPPHRTTTGREAHTNHVLPEQQHQHRTKDRHSRQSSPLLGGAHALPHRQPLPPKRAERQEELRSVIRQWEMLDTYTHDLAKYLFTRDRSTATIPEIIQAMRYPPCLQQLMRPRQFYEHRRDVFKNRSAARWQDVCVGLTDAGARLARCPMPDVSRSHQTAIADLVRTGVMDKQREEEVEVMRCRVSDADWSGFRDAVIEFRGNVTSKMERKGGQVALSELGRRDVPDALRKWLAEHEHGIDWFICRVLRRTFVLRSQFARVHENSGRDDVYVCDFLHEAD